ncbi:MAG: hypothetical protein R3C16_06470 [Hyphomonadaceae bacterium]
MALVGARSESLQKALRSLDTGLVGLDEIQIEGGSDEDNGRAAVRARLVTPKADRLLVVAEALRRGLSVEDICAASHFDPWSCAKSPRSSRRRPMCAPIACEGRAPGFRALKAQGFSDARLAKLTGQRERDVRAARRRKLGVRPQFKHIDSCAAKSLASTPVHVFHLRNRRVHARRQTNRARLRGGAIRSKQDHHSRRRPQPHRPGHRV